MAKNKTKTVLGVVRDYSVISVGIALYVLAWAVFLLPNNLMGGGVSGICAMIQYATGINMGLSNIVINSVLIITALFVVGRGFSIRTVYAIVLSSIGFAYVPEMIPSSFITEFVTENGKLLCTIIGGAMTGLGIGLTFTHGGSTGGTDIVAMMISKYRSYTPGRLLLAMDFVIISASLLVPSYGADGIAVPFATKFAVAIYAFVLVAVNGYTVDLYLTGSKQSVQVYVFSKKYKELSDAIAFDLDRGVTLLHAMGWFQKQESEVIMVVARKTDLNLILRKVKEVDPNAFISVTTAMGVYGLGFDTIKAKVKKQRN